MISARADEKLSAFLELEAAIRASQQSLITVATGEVAAWDAALASGSFSVGLLVSV
jgi:hypothetical protein